MEEVRGRILFKDRKRQIFTFENMQYGSITPTDIDGSMDYHGDVFWFAEFKHRDAPMKDGQRKHLEYLVERLSEAGCEAIAMIATHDIDDPHDDVDADLCLVREEFYNGKWHKMASGVHRTVKEATDNFLRNAERTSEQRRLNREEQRLIRQCVESIELLHNGGEVQDGKRKAV